MRSAPLLAALALAGCATALSHARPTTVFPPGGDLGSSQAQGDQGRVWVLEHTIAPHGGCYAVQRTAPKGSGIVRCASGQLEWTISRDIPEGVDDFDNLRDAMAWDAQHEGSQLDDKAVSCTLAGTPASCHVYAFTPRDGSPPRLTLIGMSQLEGRALVAQCATRPGQIEPMRPICAEIFSLQP